jgi:YegS/Rv2252/BmrU family lipid kinase
MSSPTRTLIIINYKAARAREAWREIEPRLKANRVQFDSHITTWPGNATEAARKALREGYETIAVAGGDGTLSETVEGFFEFGVRSSEFGVDLPRAINPNAAIAALPSGTGDDFARGLSGLREPRTHWIDRFVAYSIKKQSVTGNWSSAIKTVDLIHGIVDGGTKQFIAINMATIGFSAEVVQRVIDQKGLKQKLSGETRFVMAALGALTTWRERRVSVAVDEKAATESSTNLLAIANNHFAGGGMMFAPDAKIDDGRLDFMHTHNLTRLNILKELPRVRRGLHLENPNIEIQQVQRVRVETIDANDSLMVEADGNLRGRTPAEFRVIPKALRVVF